MNQLGLKLLDSSPERLDIQAGQTKLCFTRVDVDTQPVYQFTLNLTQNTPAQALYDPAGNRVDLLGDTRLSRGVVRLVLPVDDTESAAHDLQAELEFVPSSDGSHEPGTWVIGDDDCAFLLVQRSSAPICPIIATVPGKTFSETKVLDYPYYIHQWRTP